MQESQTSPSPQLERPGRGRLALALAIASWVLNLLASFVAIFSLPEGSNVTWFVILLTPFLALSSWLMARADLRKMSEVGISPLGQRIAIRAKRLGILGTFLQPLLLIALGILIGRLYTEYYTSPRDEILSDLSTLAADAYQYRLRLSSSGAGRETYEG